ncbi:MAG: ferredoxin [Candidatus Diapherotrites archaeon]|nr:ferredoxin [Candidatus Diapherotrites archaeon]
MVTVNKELCIGCGACVATCPDAFEMGDDGKSHAKDGAADADCVEAAKNACPVSAIEA